MRSRRDNIVIGIDTSCYTTSIAAISLNKDIILSEKIMLKVDKDSKGLRQSEGVFQHISNIGILSENISEKLKNYNIVGVCASEKPRPIDGSYMPVFTVGLNAGKLISATHNCPFFETTHQENHIKSSLLGKNLLNENRFLAVHMSGGTTEIVLVNKNEYNDYEFEIIGGTKDISFGQLIDRLGVKFSYNFPCGKYIDENALKSDIKIENGLKTSVKDGYMNLSGLENQLNKIMENDDNIDKYYLSKLLMDTIVRCMLKSLKYLCEKYEAYEVVFAGGVSASKYISKNLTQKLKKYNVKAYFTESHLATDNAVGCALIGIQNLNLGE